ncbi:hypothetical protein RADP37_05235 (plasmid) [Roseomonas mucosa]|uniref:Uncharacterized protein n=1 Tax=Roseomonas mucosa TaxID=207340 RepID=A0A4Y1MQG5_9PROT|nr:hypothetical protein RADP37_05235 [Roseomonas mucosa]QDD97208.1 hypothetical protein ADP8_05235 [Roseomonas mucosa]
MQRAQPFAHRRSGRPTPPPCGGRGRSAVGSAGAPGGYVWISLSLAHLSGSRTGVRSGARAWVADLRRWRGGAGRTICTWRRRSILANTATTAARGRRPKPAYRAGPRSCYRLGEMGEGKADPHTGRRNGSRAGGWGCGIGGGGRWRTAAAGHGPW